MDTTNVQYILSSEFDNKRGADLKYQYPSPISGFEPSIDATFKSGSNASFSSAITGLSNFQLANMMIPDSIEREAGRVDFTVFVLYWSSGLRQYRFVPPELTSNINSTNNNNNHADKIFFVNAVKTVSDKQNERGSKVRSVAIGTTITNFGIFKPILTLILDQLMDINSDSKQYSICLETAFASINKLDLTLLREFHSRTIQQQILQSVATDKSVVRAIFGAKNGPYQTLFDKQTRGCKDNIQITLNKITYTFFNSTSTQEKVSLIANLIDYHLVEIPLSAELNSMLLKFMSVFLPAFQKRSSRWRLIVTSTKLSKDTLTRFILALSELIDCYPLCSSPSKILVLPYVNISFVDTLRNSNLSMVIGTANPIFKSQENAWEFYYDLDEQLLYTANTLALVKRQFPFLVDFRKGSSWLKGLSVKKGNGDKSDVSNNPGTSPMGTISSVFTGLISPTNNKSSSPFLSSSPRNPLSANESLTLTMISYLIDSGCSYQVVINTLKRVNVLQIVALISFLKFSKTSSNRQKSLSPGLVRDEYERIFRDFSIFPFFFQHPYLDFIKLLSKIISNLYVLEGLSYSEATRHTVPSSSSSLSEGLKRLNTAASELCEMLDPKNQTITEQLMVVMLNFPNLFQLSNFCLQPNEFVNIYLSRLLSDAGKEKKGKGFVIARFTKMTCFESLFSVLSCVSEKRPIKQTTVINSTGSTVYPSANTGSCPTNKNRPGLPHFKQSLRRSRSLRDLLAFNPLTHSQYKNPSSTSFGSSSVNLSTLSIPSGGSLSSNTQSGENLPTTIGHTDSVMIDKQVNRLKGIICRIIYIIEEHPLGKILLQHYVSQDSFKFYEKLKSEVFQTFTIVEE